MNYRRLWVCFVVLVPADVAMFVAGVPMAICCLMNITFYLAVVPFPVSREDLRQIFRRNSS